mgnify:CR=1 FL=1
MLCLKTKGSEKAPKAAELPTNFFLSLLRLIACNKYNLDFLNFQHNIILLQNYPRRVKRFAHVKVKRYH